MRIKKNGDVWTVMGRQDVDVLLFQLQYQAGSTEAQASAMGAFPDEKGVDRPVRWLDPMSPVSTSETITIEFVESDTPSPVLTSPVKTTATPPASANVDQNCSFCGRPKANVQRLIAGPGVFICESCVALCNQVLQEPSGGAE